MARLGEGGMGEVFRARDTRLDRDVAIKILPDAFVRDAERVARFEREAKSIAALSHPNVLAIFDTGRHGTSPTASTLFVVTELLEGATLRDRLQHGALPVRKAVDYAVQIARGLAAAHDKGLVHRDLKPENVFLLPDGQVKILDFGLARPVAAGTGSGATQTVAAVTDPGMVMGTVGYMAPEQVRGHAVDGRGDVFALGTVLYEMLTGSRAFIRETTAETMTAILKEDPPELLTANKEISPALDRIIRHCLEKNVAERFQSARDAAFALESLSASGTTAIAAGDDRRPSPRRPFLVAGAFVAVAAAAWAAGYFGAHRSAADAASAVVRLDAALPLGDSFRQTNGVISLAFAPDGRTLYYVAVRNGVSQVFRRRLDSSEAEPIAGTEGAQQVYSYPNGEWLAFTSPNNTVRRVPATGGPSAVLARVQTAVLGIDVSQDGSVVFGTHSSGLFRAVDGADPVSIVPVGDMGPPRFPVALPGGKGLVFTTGGTPMSSKIHVLAAGQAAPRVLTTGTDAVFLNSGHLVFWRDGGLWAAPFDPASLALSGAAVPVVDNVAVRGSGRAGFAVAPNGTLAYVEALPSPERTLVWVNQYGKETPLNAKPGPYALARLAPDDSRIVLAYRTDATEDIWMHDIGRGVTEAFVAEPNSEWSANWTADGERIVFTSRREGPFRTYVKRANGLGDILPIGTGISATGILGRTSDGILIESGGIGVLNVTAGTVTPLWKENVIDARISPDGKWIAYCAGDQNTLQIWVRPYPDVNKDRWRVSVDGGTTPRWSPDGSTLYYRQRPSTMAVKLRPGAVFSHEPPKVLFEGPYLGDFDIAKDGRFLMIKESPRERVEEHRIVMVLNWFSELRARLGQR